MYVSVLATLVHEMNNTVVEYCNTAMFVLKNTHITSVIKYFK